jgi:predicted Zn-dependent protease
MAASLAAASEQPDGNYRTTILNSAAMNALALPNGQRYGTRGHPNPPRFSLMCR